MMRAQSFKVGRRRARLGVLAAGLGAAALLGGCMGTYVHTPESVRLCRAGAFEDWTDGGNLKLDGVDYILQFWDEGSTAAMHGPIPRVHWVEVNGYTAGRLAGWRAPPMVYDPAEALIEIEGQQVRALPRAWEIATGHGTRQVGPEVSLPLQLNDVSRQDLRGYFIAFPMRTPGAKSDYVLSPGTVLLDGQRVRIPPQRACHTEASTRWSPLR